jgi:hypothetical protein
LDWNVVCVASNDLARIGKCLVIGAALAMLVSLIQQIFFSLGLIAKPVWLLDADVEKSIPTWLSVILLFLAAGLLGLVAACEHDIRSGRWGYWLLLSVGFLLMSLDEYLELHERLPSILNSVFGLGQEQRHMLEWFPVPVAAFALLIFGRFLIGLPARVRNGLIVAGGLYCMGIIALDLVANAILGGVDHNTFGGAVLVTTEESFELAGLLVLLFVAGRYWLRILEARGAAPRGLAPGLQNEPLSAENKLSMAPRDPIAH